MEIKEAIKRIEEHNAIHFAKEYLRAIKITEALNMGVEALKKQEEIKKALMWYLDTNEENGVVYIPKFIVEKMLNKL